MLPTAALLALVVLAFANGLTGQFVLDSAQLVRDDPRVRELGRENLRHIFVKNYWWPAYESDLYRPLTTLSFALNYNLLGNRGREIGFHLVNVLLHWVRNRKTDCSCPVREPAEPGEAVADQLEAAPPLRRGSPRRMGPRD